MSAAAQGVIASDRPVIVSEPPLGPTTMRIVRYLDATTVTDVAPSIPSCYRVGRCSAYDLYRFRNRPNRLTRLAPEAPPDSVMPPAAIEYLWILAPVTSEENIVPKYRRASQVRDEYRAVGKPIDAPN